MEKCNLNKEQLVQELEKQIQRNANEAIEFHEWVRYGYWPSNIKYTTQLYQLWKNRNK